MSSICELDRKKAVCLRKGLNTYVDYFKTKVRLRDLTIQTPGNYPEENTQRDLTCQLLIT
jgi:hypothetical protein